MKRILCNRLGVLVCIILSFAVVCKADTITVSLTPLSASGVPGDLLTFSGTLSNSSGATVFLNSAGINLYGAFDPSVEDTSPFLNNAPFFLAAGNSTSTIDLFTINIPNPFAAGPYSGIFTVLGGPDANAQDIIGSASFTVQVNSGSPVPEPSSSYLLTLGLLVLASFRYTSADLSRKRTS